MISREQRLTQEVCEAWEAAGASKEGDPRTLEQVILDLRAELKAAQKVIRAARRALGWPEERRDWWQGTERSERVEVKE